MSFGRDRSGRWPITSFIGGALIICLVIGFGAGHVLWPKKVKVERISPAFDPALGESYSLVAMTSVTATPGYFPEPNPIDAIEFVVRTPDEGHPGWMLTQIISVPQALAARVPALAPGTVTFIQSPQGHLVLYNDGAVVHPGRPPDRIFSNVAFLPLSDD